MMPVLCFGQYKPLSESEVKEKHPNTGCGYYDIDGEMLFNGGNYDKKSS